MLHNSMLLCETKIIKEYRVKSGNFGHQVESDIHTFANSGHPDEKAPDGPSHEDFHFLLG